MKKTAFIAIYSKEYQPWIHDMSLTKRTRETKVSTILTISRWDGLIGFPGGYVEKEESPEEGAIREAEEEIGIQLEIEELELISKENETYFYAVEKTIEEIIEIQKEITNAIDYGSEILGSTNMYIGKYKQSFENFMNYPFVPAAKKQIQKLIKEKGLI